MVDLTITNITIAEIANLSNEGRVFEDEAKDKLDEFTKEELIAYILDLDSEKESIEAEVVDEDDEDIKNIIDDDEEEEDDDDDDLDDDED